VENNQLFGVLSDGYYEFQNQNIKADISKSIIEVIIYITILDKLRRRLSSEFNQRFGRPKYYSFERANI